MRDSTMESRYDTYGGSGTGNGSSTSTDKELKFTPRATVGGYFDRAFGTESQYGQSFGVAMADVELIDGTLYFDPEKEVYKVFSWEDVAGLSPLEVHERGNEPSVDDAADVEQKKYASTRKRYELIAARIEPVHDEDGELVIEEQVKHRDVEMDGGTPQFSDWEHTDGPVEIGDTITWWEANQEHGASVGSQQMAELLSYEGEAAVKDPDDYMNWLTDTTGNDVLRNDLKDRYVEFFITTEESENGFNYHVPVIIDTETNTAVSPNNNSGGTAGSDTESETVATTRTVDADTQPEPVADFIQTGERVQMDEERAGKLLDELVADEANPMSESLIEDAGGRDVLIDRVTE